ncbi:hypothetical protein [Cellulomonas aerilata]|uniref:Uncharacterized protein n=1 Tax=Cellulomonas aerilata TaxID=515326 RepID=A0A512D7U4_9CELL|nr:hypothetical protein [Cellulomonas aerilata]GEO32539.1 hypothetical protein CAE01nite_02640 [Cellulomonas aerilata]
MTVEPGSLLAPAHGSMLRESWREEAAARALDGAGEAVAAALRRIGEAADVEWVGGPAARYRDQLEDVAARTRTARACLSDAVRAAEEHARAVRLLGALTLAAPPTLADRWSPSPWSTPSGGGGQGLGAGQPRGGPRVGDP